MIVPRHFLITALLAPCGRATALIAGIGYGKTWLLTQAATHPQCILIRLGEIDVDPISITAAIHEALTEQFGAHQHAQLPFQLAKPNLRPAGAAAALRHDLDLYAQQLGSPLLLMLDQAEELQSDGRKFFLEHILTPDFPARAHLVLAMNDEDNLPLFGLPPNAVRIWDEKTLAFSPQEMQEYLNLPTDQRDRTLGWPTAARMAGQGHDPYDAARMILALLPEDLLPSLRRASLLGEWRIGDAAHALMGLRDGWLLSARKLGVPGTRTDRQTLLPHPILQRLLREQLEAHPDEYRDAQAGLARARAATAPLSSVEAWLEAGDEEQARRLLTEHLPKLRGSESVGSAAHLLSRLNLDVSSPLYLELAQALYDNGRIAEGLRYAQTAALASDPADPAAEIVLARMRMRTGNLALAAGHFRTALERTTDPQLQAGLHAEIAFTLGRAAIEGEYRQAADAAAHAQASRELAADDHDPHGDTALLAATAAALAEAALGRREDAQIKALYASSMIQAADPGRASVHCMLALATFHTNEGQFDLAVVCLQYAERISGQLHQGEGAHQAAEAEIQTLLHLARARMELRQGNPAEAARHAMLASDSSRDAQVKPLRFHALALGVAANLFPVTGVTSALLSALRTEFGHENKVSEAISMLADAFAIPGETPHRVDRALHDQDLHPELRTLLALKGMNRYPELGFHKDLSELHQRYGPAVVSSYAELCGVELTDSITMPLRVHLVLLRDTPEIIVDGTDLRRATPAKRKGSVPVVPRMIAMMLTFYLHRAIKTDAFPQYLGHAGTASNRSRLSDLRSLLAGCNHRVSTKGHGVMDTRQWRWTSDLDQLRLCSFEELTSLYCAPVFASCGDDYPVVTELRRQARQVLMQRIHQWMDTDRTAALAAFEQLRRVDPLLRAEPALAAAHS